MAKHQELITQAYHAFNSRDIDAVLNLLHPDVDWPNGWEGGYVKGHDEVRNYWLRQWQELNPNVTPVSFSEMPDGRINVTVHQFIKDLQDNVLADSSVRHIYTIDHEKIKRMDILPA
ncbi:nuclear transport factor 2 family protein [Spirosoma sp. BT702]|uniref:Nuclear transport factor 2 family protein n=1 Tax=Spirosoma profusum TaxID=2771354 RepID=A0A926Y460_9BACT|nr:nuclear transport factor 2 family protein [Spirosoma profusum]MBD2702711.1 nuclear transport factor 2 family protein [Spirosoma profusum]